MTSWTIAISNQKGGVGKTTTCMSLGACLAGAGYNTLVVDLDSQSNLTMSAGIDPDALEVALPDLLEPADNNTKITPNQVILKTVIEGLDILPSDLRLAGTERAIYDVPDYENLLKNTLSTTKDKYKYILLDCPPSLGSLTLTALTAADIVLIPVQCEYYSARGLMRLLDVLEAVQQHTNASIDYMLVATMFDKRTRITKQVYEQLQENFSSKFLTTVIGVDTKLRESSVLGEPITVYAPRSRSAIRYRKLAQEIIAKLDSQGA